MTDFNPVPWLRKGAGDAPQDGGCIMQVIDWISSEGWTDKPECVHPALRQLAIHANDELDDAGRQQILTLAPRLMGTQSDDRQLALHLALFCCRRVLPTLHAVNEYSKPNQALELAEKLARYPQYESIFIAGVVGELGDLSHDLYNGSVATSGGQIVAFINKPRYLASCAACAIEYVVKAAARLGDKGDASFSTEIEVAASSAISADGDKLGFLLAVLDEYERIAPPAEHESVDWAPVCAVMAG